jgi:M-phase inducer tyrosine phosphatase
LYYPEIYLLEGGYKEFFGQYPYHCEGTYTPMSDDKFKENCKNKYS